MATQTVAVPSVPLQFPQPESAAKVISQTELALVLSLRGRLKQLEEQVAAAEQSLKTRLQAGAPVQPGDHTAELKENSRRNVSWKAVVIRLAVRLKLDGEAYCESVLASTQPTRSVSLIVK